MINHPNCFNIGNSSLLGPPFFFLTILFLHYYRAMSRVRDRENEMWTNGAFKLRKSKNIYQKDIDRRRWRHHGKCIVFLSYLLGFVDLPAPCHWGALVAIFSIQLSPWGCPFFVSTKTWLASSPMFCISIWCLPPFWRKPTDRQWDMRCYFRYPHVTSGQRHSTVTRDQSMRINGLFLFSLPSLPMEIIYMVNSFVKVSINLSDCSIQFNRFCIFERLISH